MAWSCGLRSREFLIHAALGVLLFLLLMEEVKLSDTGNCFAVSLLGAESIDDKTKEGHVLATCVVSASSQAHIYKEAMLLGAEWINEQKMEHAHVLATTNVMSAPASLLLSSSRRCYLKIVSSSADHNDDESPRIVFNNISIFVENIIPLTSLLV
uniref:Uncharacterized protein n=1 Tax=Solanum tuberosum TaxID=4113 RepID=M1A2H1_SOLTU